MTRNNEFNATETALQMICENGMDGLVEAIRLLSSEAMKIERAQALGAMPYERTEGRREHANGYKPKTVATRLGAVKFYSTGTRTKVWSFTHQRRHAACGVSGR